MDDDDEDSDEQGDGKGKGRRAGEDETGIDPVILNDIVDQLKAGHSERNLYVGLGKVCVFFFAFVLSAFVSVLSISQGCVLRVRPFVHPGYSFTRY